MTSRLSYAGAYRAQKGNDFPPHQHDAMWELVYYREGRIPCTIGPETYHVYPGILLATPPATLHAEHAQTHYANYFFGVEAPLEIPWPRLCHDDEERSLGRLCQTLVAEHGGQSWGRAEMLSLLMGQLDLYLRRAFTRQSKSPAEVTVCAAEQVMEELYGQRLSVEEIAQAAGVCASTLHSHFARMRGTTPMGHLREIRLRHSLALLRRSSLTLEAVACLCGFDSASHLTRHVKAATGRTPGQLRH